MSNYFVAFVKQVDGVVEEGDAPPAKKAKNTQSQESPAPPTLSAPEPMETNQENGFAKPSEFLI